CKCQHEVDEEVPVEGFLRNFRAYYADQGSSTSPALTSTETYYNLHRPRPPCANCAGADAGQYCCDCGRAFCEACSRLVHENEALPLFLTHKVVDIQLRPTDPPVLCCHGHDAAGQCDTCDCLVCVEG
ncbi:hypothetical protein KIPB_015306, partial [Kipferlia bialata]